MLKVLFNRDKNTDFQKNKEYLEVANFKINSAILNNRAKPTDPNFGSEALKKFFVDANVFNITDCTDLLPQIIEIKKPLTSLLINQGDKIIPVKIADIALFYCEDNYIFAFTYSQKKYIVSQSLEKLEAICSSNFFRANRQYLINRSAVKDASRYFNNKVLVNLSIAYPNQILVSRSRVVSFIEWLTLE